MQDSNKIWYVCYGSNILASRFYCYIRGGQPEGTFRRYTGCRNKSLPLKSKPVGIPYQLYFAKSSKTWNGGGVAFIHPRKKPSFATLGKAFLISRQQFVDLVKQEIDSTENLFLDFEKTRRDGRLLYRPEAWYSELLFLGEFDGYPQFTFTSHQFLSEELAAPDVSYLSKITRGIKNTYPEITAEKIRTYFKNKPGCENFNWKK